MAQPTNFDPNEFAKWLFDGLKETIAYRLRQTFNRERIFEELQTRIPTQNQVLHLVLRQAFESSGFKFEKLKQGDAEFFLIRKTIHKVPLGQRVRRLIMVPGFGDTPASWLPLYSIMGRELVKAFDEIILIDFPGYTGFLSNHPLISSMTLIQSLVKMVCEANPPTVLMGHSLGGWLAGKTAQEIKTPIDHLILIAPSGLTPDENERRKFGDFIVQNQDLHLDELLNLIMHDPGNVKILINEEIKNFFAKPEIKKFVETVKPEEFIDHQKGFNARKVTTIWGEDDRFVPSQWTRYWVEYYGEYLDAYLMKRTGHLPQLERPIILAQILDHELFGETFRTRFPGGWVKIQSRKREFATAEKKMVLSNALPENT